jgi:hypothetical protein
MLPKPWIRNDALYQGHFLLSSILGCHPPLVGHAGYSIFLRTKAVNQCGRMRSLRKAQHWLILNSLSIYTISDSMYVDGFVITMSSSNLP